MKIVVPVKQVARLADGFKMQNSQVDPDFLEHELNEWDSFSLAAAVDLASRTDATVVAVSVGDDQADAALREAIALGASRVTRVDPPSEQGLDALQVARLLAEFVTREEADLALCGVQSTDAAAGLTPPATAGYLDWPRIGSVLGVEIIGGGLSVQRELDGGAVETVELGLPAVLAVQSGAYEVQYPTFKAKMAAKRAAIEVVDADDLVPTAELFRLRGATSLGLVAKPHNNSGVALEGPPRHVAAEIRRIIEECLA